MTKSTSTDFSDSTSVDLYYVNFKKGNKTGFSIATSDKRLNRVYAYTDCANIEDTAKFEPLKDAIEVIPQVIEEDLKTYYDSPATKASTTEIAIGPLLKTRWEQGYPYNKEIAHCEQLDGGIYNGHFPLGCVPVATAQVIAYYKKFSGTYFGNDKIDFDRLTSSPTIYSYSDDEQDLTHPFFR